MSHVSQCLNIAWTSWNEWERRIIYQLLSDWCWEIIGNTDSTQHHTRGQYWAKIKPMQLHRFDFGSVLALVWFCSCISLILAQYFAAASVWFWLSIGIGFMLAPYWLYWCSIDSCLWYLQPGLVPPADYPHLISAQTLITTLITHWRVGIKSRGVKCKWLANQTDDIHVFCGGGGGVVFCIHEDMWLCFSIPAIW